MKPALRIYYYDRETRTVMEEPIYARGFLNWSYNTRTGISLTELLFRQKILSQIYGWLHRQRWSRRRIRPFVEALGVKTDEVAQPLDQFATFNDFFTRKIDLSKRPINPDPRVCIAPADGRILAFPVISGEETFCIKRGTFNLQKFLGSEVLANRYAGGALVITRLHLADYHHFHFAASGVPGAAMAIPGKLYAVSPYSIEALIPFYTENRRMLTLFASDQFGQIAMVEIGAFTVGSIKQCYRADIHVAKGAEKGFFELGGSTVALLFEPGAIRLDKDLCAKTEAGLETYVRLGESIGRT